MVKLPGSFNYLSFLRVGYWNVLSLVEINSGIKTATVHSKGRPVQIDKKINFWYKN